MAGLEVQILSIAGQTSYDLIERGSGILSKTS
jgi:hypothetical protein